MVKPSSILSSLMSRPKPPVAVSGNSNFYWQPSENTSTTSTSTDNSFAQYYQSTFFSKLDALNGVKRFNERYRIKGHLGAGAHGLILWATDRTPPQPQPSVFDTKNSTTTVDSFDLEQNVLETEDAYFQDTSSDGEDSDATTVDDEEGELATKRQIFSSKSRQYAVKRMFIRNRVVPVSVIREIKVLQYLSSGRRGHPHIIDLLDVSPSGSSVNLVFPLLPTNLTTLIYSSPPSLNSRQCALYGRMLAEGVAYLHSNGIIHRDLKPANLLIDWEGILKIADFGQARAIDIGLEVNGRRSELTYQVCTRWYRAPELLYGATNYGYDVDLWSVGCILGEMLGRWPLFKGDTDIEQLSLVVRALGTPKGAWTELLPDFNKITFVHDEEVEEREGKESFDDQQILSTGGSTRWPRWLESLRQKCCSRGSPAPSASSSSARCPDQALDLLFKLCRYTDRLNAQELLAHPFLNFEPGAGKALRRLLVRSKAVKHLSGPQKNHEPPPPPPNPLAVVV